MLFTLFLLPLASALSLSNRHDSHDHSIKKQLPGTWFHERDHPVYALFKRDNSSQPAAVGTPAWAAGFPSPNGAPDSTKLPQEWVDALNAAVSAGVIPNLPQSSGTPDTNPVYPAGHDPTGPEICSATYKCRNPGDFWDAPAGHFGTGFDDGPTPSTPKLLQFLANNNEKATHFMIGVQIIYYPQQFLQAFHAGEDIAVHTWNHPHMTTLSNLDVIAQLGWTIQLIYTSTGGLVPKFWRPPYGDSDNRVRAIAKEVFGLETIIWNQDTEDWSMPTGTTMQAINASFTKWITGPKSPGLIVLEHELTDQTVAAFISAYPVLKANGWTMAPVTQLVDGTSAYWNAGGTSGPINSANILDFGANKAGSSTIGTVGATQAAAQGSQTTPSSPSSSASTSTSTSTSSSSTGSSSPDNSTVKDSSALQSQLGQGTTWTILLGLSWLLL